MKTFLAFLGLIMLLLSAQAQYCKRPLLNSYSLEGEVAFTDKQHPICTTIKKNCCTADDTKKILSDYNNFLKPKLDEFQAKMGETFTTLTQLHSIANMIKMRTDLTGPQAAYCASAQDQFSSFPFNKLIEDYKIGFAVSSRLFRELHGTFYCALCDFDAQQFIALETRSIALDSGTCLNILASNRLFLSAQNVNMIQYFQNLQNLIDCNTFTDLYNFPFLYSDRLQLANNFKKCYTNFDPDTMSEDCAKVCETLGTGTISSIFEGDFDFVAQAASYFISQLTRLQARPKRGSFNPLKAVQKLNDENDVVDFFQIQNKNVARMNETASWPKRRRRLRSAFDGLEPQGTLTNIWEKLARPVRSLFGMKNTEEKLKDLKKQSLLKSKKKQKLLKKKAAAKKIKKSKLGHEFAAISKSQQEILKKLKKAFRSSKNSRILSDDGNLPQTPVPLFQDLFQPRILQAVPAGNNPLKAYETLYDSFQFLFDQQSSEMNPRKADPYNIGKFKIMSTFGAGLNLGLYLGAMNWDISPESLSKILKGATNLDDDDPFLNFLLVRVDDNFVKFLNKDISADYAMKIDPDAMSPNDVSLKTTKPPTYLDFEIFEQSYRDFLENQDREFDVLPSPFVDSPDSTFNNRAAYRSSRRLRQSKTARSQPKRVHWVEKTHKIQRKMSRRQESKEEIVERRLRNQMRRSEGYGHGRKSRSRQTHGSRGRQLSARFLLENVEGDLNIQPWLNV